MDRCGCPSFYAVFIRFMPQIACSYRFAHRLLAHRARPHGQRRKRKYPSQQGLIGRALTHSRGRGILATFIGALRGRTHCISPIELPSISPPRFSPKARLSEWRSMRPLSGVGPRKPKTPDHCPAPYQFVSARLRTLLCRPRLTALDIAVLLDRRPVLLPVPSPKHHEPDRPKRAQRIRH